MKWLFALLFVLAVLLAVILLWRLLVRPRRKSPARRTDGADLRTPAKGIEATDVRSGMRTETSTRAHSEPVNSRQETTVARAGRAEPTRSAARAAEARADAAVGAPPDRSGRAEKDRATAELRTTPHGAMHGQAGAGQRTTGASTIASPYGAGSALPRADGSAPSGEYRIKGNEQSMLYHTIDSPYYDRTEAEVWFRSEADARRAGFTAWNQNDR